MHHFKNRGHGGRKLFPGADGQTRGPHGFGEGRHGLFGGRGRRGETDRVGEDRPHGFGGRRGKRFSGDELRLMVLQLLDGTPQHGYQLIRHFAETSGDSYTPSPGVLYPLLTLLADMGLIAETASETGSSRRSFALTETGKAELVAQTEVATAALVRLATMAGETRRTDPAPVRRAMLNLRTAATQRLTSADATEEVAFGIAEIIDEAARRIERLKLGE